MQPACCIGGPCLLLLCHAFGPDLICHACRMKASLNNRSCIYSFMYYFGVVPHDMVFFVQIMGSPGKLLSVNDREVDELRTQLQLACVSI